MMMSAPIYRLKRRAKQISRAEKIPLHEALDHVAREEGYARWSLLVAKAAQYSAGRRVNAALNPGEMVLLAARPGHGKTVLGIELAVEAVRAGYSGVFFTLEYSPADVLSHLGSMDVDRKVLKRGFRIDDSDDLNADRIVRQLASVPEGSVGVVDYLQLLDQKRVNPPLAEQVGALKDFARRRRVVLAFITQVHRTFDSANRAWPCLEDIRLPNPLDLSLFDKACFLQNGRIRVEAVARGSA